MSKGMTALKKLTIVTRLRLCFGAAAVLGALTLVGGRASHGGGVWFFLCLLLMAALGAGIWFFLCRPIRSVLDSVEQFLRDPKSTSLTGDRYVICDPVTKAGLRLRIDEIRREQVAASNQMAQYLALQNQINPHFLYNTLEAIRADALCAGLEDVAVITETLATYFRYTISDTDHLTTLSSEIANVENYFSIQHYRFGDKLKMEIVLQRPELNQLYLPKLTLQPIVENAIHHGLCRKIGGGTVIIQAEATQTHLFLSVRDDGVGIPDDQLQILNRQFGEQRDSPEVFADVQSEQRCGIALYNIDSRIKLLFGKEYGLHLFSREDIGTDVRITLPLLLEEEQ